MNYFLRLIEEHKFAYIVVISAIATVLVLNSAIEFAERIIKNSFLLMFSLLAFISLVWVAIKIETKRKWQKEKRKKLIFLIIPQYCGLF